MPCSQVTSANAFFYVLYFFCFNGFCFIISRLVILCVILFHSTFLRFYTLLYFALYIVLIFFRISSPRSYTFLLRFAFLIPRPSLVFSRFAASLSLSLDIFSALFTLFSISYTALSRVTLHFSVSFNLLCTVYRSTMLCLPPFFFSVAILHFGLPPVPFSGHVAPRLRSSPCFVLRRFALFYLPLFRFALSRVRTRGFGEIRAGLTALCNLLAARRERERERASPETGTARTSRPSDFTQCILIADLTLRRAGRSFQRSTPRIELPPTPESRT